MRKETVSRTTLTKGFWFLYLFLTGIISYTVFYSPFIAGIYLPLLIVVYVILYLTSYYLVGWTYTRNKWKARVKEAERRVREREVFS